MPIERENFDAINEADLQELLENRVPEGTRLDYKRDMYGSTDTDKVEFLKDISAFPNSNGGHLIIGIDEPDEATGLPSAINGLRGDADATCRRLESIARTGLDPILTSTRIKHVQLENGNFCIFIRVPRSWNQPHMITATGKKKFYIRTDTSCHEATREELRLLFTSTSDIRENIRKYHSKRAEAIRTGQTPYTLDRSAGTIVLHIVPLAAFSQAQQIDLAVIKKNHSILAPFGAQTFGSQYCLDGVLVPRESACGYTLVNNNGLIEVTKSKITRNPKQTGYPSKIMHAGIERDIMNAVPKYIDLLKQAGATPPFVVCITFFNVLNAWFTANASNSYPPDDPQLIDRDIILLPEAIIDEFGNPADYHKALNVTFDALWRCSGFERDLFFDDTGTWIGK